MAAKARGSKMHLMKRKSRRARAIVRGGVNVRSKGELKALPQRHYKPAPALPPAATKLTPEGQKYIKHGKMEMHHLGSDTRNVAASPFRTGQPLF